VQNDIHTIRFSNYRYLYQRFANQSSQKGLPARGMLRRFATSGALSASHLSLINGGHRQIGDALARQMEAGFGKPYGWLDQQHRGRVLVEREIDSQRLFLHALSLDHDATMQALQSIVNKKRN